MGMLKFTAEKKVEIIEAFQSGKAAEVLTAVTNGHRCRVNRRCAVPAARV